MEETESSKLEAVKIKEMLFQKLEEAQTVTEKLSAESQMLADKLRKEGDKSRKLSFKTSWSSFTCKF